MLKCVLTLVLATTVFALSAHAFELSCYDDDSLDVINQDQVRAPLPWEPPGSTKPVPLDCAQAPKLTWELDGNAARKIWVGGALVYDDGFDLVESARVSPTGVAAFATQRGRVFRYDPATGLKLWFELGVPAVFKMARSGAIVARTSDRKLVAERDAGGEGKVIDTDLKTVKHLYVSREGDMAVLFDDGSVRRASGQVLYLRASDPATAVKIALDGTVGWLTAEGAVGTTRLGDLDVSWSADPAVAFHLNARGQVAYLTRDGVLGRDGTWLSRGQERVTSFTIDADGVVQATFANGRHAAFH